MTDNCFRDVQDKVQQNELMLEDYCAFMNGTPSAGLLARLEQYNTLHPEARIAARAWVVDRVARTRAIRVP
jgi:hypothetical protein